MEQQKISSEMICLKVNIEDVKREWSSVDVSGFEQGRNEKSSGIGTKQSIGGRG
jgi:hypothetical protein